MRVKDIAILFVVVIAGMFATEMVDRMLGVSLMNYTDWQKLGHMTALMIYGAVVWQATKD